MDEQDSPFYFYKIVSVLKVVDGDTVDLEVDLGLNIFTKDRFRLYGIDAYEIKGLQKTKGIMAKEFLQDLLSRQQDLQIQTFEDVKCKYGRWLCVLYNGDFNINHLMVAKGHAVFKEY